MGNIININSHNQCPKTDEEKLFKYNEKEGSLEIYTKEFPEDVREEFDEIIRNDWQNIDLVLEKSSYKTLFKINFLLKSFLDLGFSLYVINYLRISLLSFLGLSLIFEPIFFGLLAYYTEKKNSFLHGVFIYGSVFFFLIYQVLLSLLIKNQIFIIYTCIQAILSFFIAFGSLFYKRTNVYIQIICVSVSYVWMLIFVFNYL